MEATLKAIDLLGGVVATAKIFGVTKAAVSNWKARGCIPVEHCPTVERLTEGQIRCEELNASVDWAYLRQTQTIEPAAEPTT